MSEAVLLTIDGPIATVTLNRPEAYNALNGAMIEGLHRILPQVERDPAVKVVILNSNGPAFMAGGDVKMFVGSMGLSPEEKSATFEHTVLQIHPVVTALRRMPKPVVAQVQGAAAGFGMSLLMACDLAIAADDSYYTLAYCLIGTSPDGGSTFGLPRIVGMKKAMEIALLGDRFDAATAERLGLVNRIVPAAELAAETVKLARRLAAGPSIAYAATKRLLQQSINTSLESQLQAEAESFARCAASADFQEGVTAFIEKRQPRFTGN
jgi:2-(1,2-epoxy-1,2-dihydrophenyl)acetyl-CoA isomerase